ncbi:MAG TPA: DUF411 domain-containing protein [Luteimonas sp.]|nr:DUF411 domain-containing protein [Luteimonas sp.]HRO26689.1 DUF411 domain-containing protein [Luteimonas sp.]HRP71965.1 DUF411 domain-containing protein [Luteimonas sp.]
MLRLPSAIAALSLLLGACGAAEPATAPAAIAATAPAEAAAPLLTVYKHPTCGCCGLWNEHIHEAGFRVEAHDREDMAAVKAEAGVPMALASCHTAKVGGYFIEGHVPAADVARLLRERPAARGLAVPGMPLGSPGMEHPQGIVHPYAVLLVLEDGSTREFSRYPQD